MLTPGWSPVLQDPVAGDAGIGHRERNVLGQQPAGEPIRVTGVEVEGSEGLRDLRRPRLVAIGDGIPEGHHGSNNTGRELLGSRAAPPPLRAIATWLNVTGTVPNLLVSCTRTTEPP